MGLFKKGSEKKKEEIPQLPELPKLPELPRLKGEGELPQLPSFPRNSLGDKFSQNSIKDAITGRKEDEEFEANEFAGDEEPEMMQQPLPGRRPMTREMEESEEEAMPVRENSYSGMGKRTEPIFVRLDKFEETEKILEKTRHQVLEIEDMLREIRRTKEQEEKELQLWEGEIQSMKKQIERIDKDIFSRLE
jgi:hypothetical protein